MKTPSSSKPSGAGQVASADNKATEILPVPGGTINDITHDYRDFSFAQDQRKRLDLALGAYLRRALGWRKDLPEKERLAIAKEAAAIANDPEGTPFEIMVHTQRQGRACFVVVEEDALNAMSKLAETLPVWKSWGKGIKGFGAKSLAVIVAEAGDLANYPDHSKLWKRMGLAVFDGVRQGGLAKGAGAEAWIEHGYSPKRRSQMWVIGESLIKAQVRQVKNDEGEDTGERISLGEYGQLYLDRKELELERDPTMPPIKAHRRAQRYMEKRLLKHLWQSWRRAMGRLPEKALNTLPAAEPIHSKETELTT